MHRACRGRLGARRGYRTVATPPTICFIDLTGYTLLTEELGDEAAAHIATDLSAMVGKIAGRHGGRPVRWLGDGGMFLFREPGAAVLAGLEMVETAPLVGLPPVHIGIHTGPVVFQEGDVYGRTVNLASRIASHAKAGEVLATDETASRSPRRCCRSPPSTLQRADSRRARRSKGKTGSRKDGSCWTTVSRECASAQRSLGGSRSRHAHPSRG